MHDARNPSRRTDYEQSRPAPSAVTSLALAVALPVALLVLTAAPLAVVPAAAVALPLLAVRWR